MRARILQDVDMSPWPPKTYLIQMLDEGMPRFDAETGEKEVFEFIALTLLENNEEAYVFPSNASGGFVDTTMTPMRRRPNAAFPHAILNEMGYEIEQ